MSTRIRFTFKNCFQIVLLITCKLSLRNYNRYILCIVSYEKCNEIIKRYDTKENYILYYKGNIRPVLISPLSFCPRCQRPN